MPNNQDGSGQNQPQNQNRGGKNSQAAVKMSIEGSLNKCNISVVSKPNLIVGFYAGNQNGNPLVWKVSDGSGNHFSLTTDNNGIALGSNVDLSVYGRISDFDCLTAVAEGKQSASIPLPTDVSGGGVTQGKNLKIVSPDEERFVKHDANKFPIEILTYERPKVLGSREVILTADGPVTIYDRDGNVLATNVSRWEFSTDARGGHYHVIAPCGFAYREVKYRLDGETETLKRILEFV